MAIYFFDVFNGVEHTRDEVGDDQPDRDTARRHAQVLLGQTVQEELPDGARRDFIVDVRDSRGILIYTCSLSLAGRWVDFSLPPSSNRGSLFTS